MRSLVLSLALSLAPLGAQAASVPPIAHELAAVPPQRLAERIAEAHAATDAALRARQAVVQRHRALVKERDQAALAVDAEKRALAAGKSSPARVAQMLSVANTSDERVQAAHADVRAADREVATRGAELLKLYDALLVEKKRELARLSTNDTRRAPLVLAYQRFAGQRDVVREALRPALAEMPALSRAAPSLEVRAGDDVETLLEKADLARDLEARLVAQADALRRRIQEIEAEQGLARDVAGLARTGALFDEADRRLRVPASVTTGRGPVRVTLPTFALPSAPMAAGDGATDREVGGAPPNSDDEGGAPTVDTGNPDPNAPPPPSDPVDVPSENDGDFTAGEGVDDAPGVGLDNSRDNAPSALGVGGSSGSTGARGPTEQVFIGGRDGRTTLDTLVATEGMSLDELRTLEKKLRADAVRARQQGKALRQTVDAELNGTQKK